MTKKIDAGVLTGKLYRISFDDPIVHNFLKLLAREREDRDVTELIADVIIAQSKINKTLFDKCSNLLATIPPPPFQIEEPS